MNHSPNPGWGTIYFGGPVSSTLQEVNGFFCINNFHLNVGSSILLVSSILLEFLQLTYLPVLFRDIA